MYGLVLDHLQGLMLVLDNDVPATEVDVELLKAKVH